MVETFNYNHQSDLHFDPKVLLACDTKKYDENWKNQVKQKIVNGECKEKSSYKKTLKACCT